MAYDIGPRIKITGEKEFNDQINRINNSLKEYGSELKAVSSRFLENENNQEALIEKNKILQKQYETQEQKLKIYQAQLDKQKNLLKDQKKEIENLTNKYGENSKEVIKAQNAYKSTENNISKLSTSINETTAYTNKLSSDINKNTKYLNEMDEGLRDAASGMSLLNDSSKKAANGLEDIDKKLDDTNKKLDDISDKVSKKLFLDAADNLSGASEKISEFGEKALNSFTQIEDAAKKANGYFGETGEIAQKNEDLIKRIYEDGLGDSLDTIADALIKVKSNLKDLNDQDLYNITEQAIILEDTFGVDMNETLRGINALMTHFGLSAREAMDYIVKGTQEGLDWTNELGDNISEYSGNFAQAGYSAQDYFQLLKNGADGGAYNLDKINDSINEITNRLADGTIEGNLDQFSKGTAKLFKAWQSGKATQKDVIDSIVNDISKCTNEQKALTMAATAFGTMGEDANLNVVRSLTTLGDTFNDVNGSATRMNENTTTESQKLEGNIRKIDNAFASVGEVLAKIANEILPPIADGISFLGDLFGSLPEPVQTFVVILGALVVVLTTLTPIIASVSFALGSLEISLLPVIAAIVGISAAIAAIIFVFKNWDSIVEWFSQQWNEFISGWTEEFRKFSDWFNQKASDLSKWFSDLAKNISNGIDDIVNFFGTLPGRIGTWLDETITNIAQWGANMIDKGVNSAKDLIDGIANFFKSLPGMALEWGADMIDGFVKGIKDSVGWVIDAVSDVADTITSWLHFSKPDVGPLREYEKWMPDMMHGMAKGIRNNRWKIEDELSNLAENMKKTMNPEIETSAKTRYDSNITINTNMILDGKVIAKSTEKHVFRNQKGRRVAMGG